MPLSIFSPYSEPLVGHLPFARLQPHTQYVQADTRIFPILTTYAHKYGSTVHWLPKAETWEESFTLFSFILCDPSTLKSCNSSS